jgi:hypothetical protein
MEQYTVYVTLEDFFKNGGKLQKGDKLYESGHMPEDGEFMSLGEVTSIDYKNEILKYETWAFSNIEVNFNVNYVFVQVEAIPNYKKIIQ